jgi:GT2 family glycosyltransferase
MTLGFNSARFLQGYFDSFRKLNYPKDRLIINILDNHPDNDTYKIIKERYLNDNTFPFQIKLYRSDKNLGFTGGNNFLFKKLLKESKAPYYFLLNIDTEIDPECISLLTSSMQIDKTAGMIEALQEPKEHPKYYDPETNETGWCSGGGVLIRSKALRQTGLFDDRFFLYCEDVDLSWRMWLEGWKCKVNPKAKFNHFTEHQDEKKDMSIQQYYSMRNCFYMHYKYDSSKGLKSFYKLFFDVLDKQTDEKTIQNLKKAFADAQSNKLKFLSYRLFRLFRKNSPWIIFNEFSFEIRREFVDTPDGKRLITPLPSGLVKKLV